MRSWPLPSSSHRDVPTSGPGSFWEDRIDRRHCGVDLYAARGSPVASVEDGLVLEVGVFTSPRRTAYWNATFYILVQGQDGRVLNYAELERLAAAPGDQVRTGDLLGQVGQVLNPEAIGDEAPPYIQRLRDGGCSSMLHLELYSSWEDSLLADRSYSGGNWFAEERPEGLLDPSAILL
ncbi:MAG: M23 family metallopeptidase [Methanosarcinales archaeon]|nr:M23 family metallopeptidase [Methanosarcinales archaeon]